MQNNKDIKFSFEETSSQARLYNRVDLSCQEVVRIISIGRPRDIIIQHTSLTIQSRPIFVIFCLSDVVRLINILKFLDRIKII